MMLLLMVVCVFTSRSISIVMMQPLHCYRRSSQISQILMKIVFAFAASNAVMQVSVSDVR